eukprot:SAG11_NODE_2587_length_3194_cov_2.322456_3_plen_200_part_00
MQRVRYREDEPQPAQPAPEEVLPISNTVAVVCAQRRKFSALRATTFFLFCCHEQAIALSKQQRSERTQGWLQPAAAGCPQWLAALCVGRAKVREPLQVHHPRKVERDPCAGRGTEAPAEAARPPDSVQRALTADPEEGSPTPPIHGQGGWEHMSRDGAHEEKLAEQRFEINGAHLGGLWELRQFVTAQLKAWWEEAGGR